MKEFEIRTTHVIVLPKGEPLFSEFGTEVFIEDTSGGEFVVINQEQQDQYGKVAISPEEWPSLKLAIETMIKNCKEIK